jgi:putative membrane protein
MWRAVLAAWHWRPDVTAVLGTLAALYVFGWCTLRRAGHREASPGLAALAYLGGLATAGVALLSPLAVFQSSLLTVHMVQHELLMIVAAPLVLLAKPLAVLLWGLPPGTRRGMGRLLRPGGTARAWFDACTRPVAAWSISTAVLWLWHIPAAYDAVESHPLLHDAQHIAFFVSGLVFWWPVMQAPPYRHRLTLPGRVGYLVAGTSQRSLLGGILALSGRPFYSHYLDVLRIGRLSPLDDQRFAGGIMWFASGLILLGATVAAIWCAPAQDGPATASP